MCDLFFCDRIEVGSFWQVPSGSGRWYSHWFLAPKRRRDGKNSIGFRCQAKKPDHLMPAWGLGMINILVNRFVADREPGSSFGSLPACDLFRRPTLLELGRNKRDDLFVFEPRT